MSDYIQKLIELLRGGNYEDASEKIGLLSAALKENGGADAPLMVSLLTAPQAPIRLAALGASENRQEPEILEAIKKLVADSDLRVREKVAATIEKLPVNVAQFSAELHKLAKDKESSVRLAAVRATAGHPEFLNLQQKLLSGDSLSSVKLAAAEALQAQKSPEVVKFFLAAIAKDNDEDMRQKCAEWIEERLAQSAEQISVPNEKSILLKAEQILRQENIADQFPKLMDFLSSRTVNDFDPAELSKYGTDWTSLAGKNALPRSYGIRETTQAVLKMLTAQNARSTVLLGEPGVGKTAVVHELCCELMKPENGGWHVLRVTPSEFLAGTKWLGEWETKLRDLIQLIRRPRRILLYIPNIGELVFKGRHSNSDNNVAKELAPYIQDGSILLLGESTPEDFQSSFGKESSLQRLFEKVLIQETGHEKTRLILEEIRKETACNISDAGLDQILEFSVQFLGNIRRPGNAAGLLRLLAESCKDSPAPIEARHILSAISKSTGLPTDLLDDRLPIDIAAVRAFFEKRVMGQPEAVDAILDLIVLIKAGLTDPNKPMGVLLFAGPTGVGKTELARSLAEFILGDAARLRRFDMSEYAAREGFERLIGTSWTHGVLTDAIRGNPFSVVLLDEIEKSNINVFDLCLQIFDAGRLTDGQGRTVDFRRTIVILTTNLGSKPALFAPPGFISSEKTSTPESDKERTLKELFRFFRPEFLNRIDRIINFRPLSLEVSENIARREVNAVLQRSGLSRRKIAVDVDPSALSFLVKEGYSPYLGARPLKRAVERHALMPLARVIAEGRISEGAILHLFQNGKRLEVKVFNAQAETAIPVKADKNDSLIQTAKELVHQWLDLDRQIQPLSERKSRLLLKTHESNFYQDANLRKQTFDEIHKLDQFLALYGKFQSDLTGLQKLLDASSSKNQALFIRERIEELSKQFRYIQLIAGSRDAAELGDALLCLTLVDRSGDAQHAVQKLAQMYLSYAGRHGMEGEILAEHFNTQENQAYI